MKTILKSYIILGIILILAPACTDVLEEQPRSVLVPEYFSSPAGIDAGVVAAYAYLRFVYGAESQMSLTVMGTDEFTHGVESLAIPINTYAGGLNPESGMIGVVWSRAYAAINTCNGVLEKGPEADMNPDERAQLLAEAKYLRAHWYFLLVQFYGDVTLSDKFNTEPSPIASRTPMSDVYDLIVQDLIEAAEELPDVPSEPGRAGKAAAKHLLSKVYLTRAWRLNQATDFDNAYNVAKELIDNRATYGVELLADYADIHREGNEYNTEVIFTCERNNDELFNFTTQTYGVDPSIGNSQNRSNFFFRIVYERLPGMLRDMENGRPWARFKPTDWLLNDCFADKVNDSRFYKSFKVAWICNFGDDPRIPSWTQAEADSGWVDASLVGQLKFEEGDTAIYFHPVNLSVADSVKFGCTVYTPRAVSAQNAYFPTMKKYDDTQRADIQATSVRPYIVYKFSEVYLIAAEAAYKAGNAAEAANMINVLRTRAAVDAAAVPAMQITAGDVDIDFILAERSRELCGESMRWYDLVRTGKLIERVRAYNPQAAPNIQDHHALRPIPQTQIDLCQDPTQPDGKYPQNPGYN
jgi:hypothetical protein